MDVDLDETVDDLAAVVARMMAEVESKSPSRQLLQALAREAIAAAALLLDGDCAMETVCEV